VAGRAGRLAEQRQSARAIAAEPGRLGRPAAAGGGRGGIGRELRRELEGGGGRRVAAAAAGALAGRRQRDGDRLIRRHGARRRVPGGAVGVVRRDGLRVGPVRRAPVGSVSAREHDGAHERVGERRAARRERDETGALGRLEAGDRAGERTERVVVGHGEREQRGVRGRLQRVEPAAERPLDPRADGHVVVDRPGPQPRRLGGELAQRERVAGRRRVQPRRGRRRDRPARARLEQGVRRRLVQPAERELLQVGAVERGRLAGAHGDEHDDGVGE
jgi:hypothetical protein